MSLFSMVLIFIIFLCLVFNKTYKNKFISILAFYVFVYMNIEVGYFYKSSTGSTYRYSYFVGLLVCMMSIIIIIKKLHNISGNIYMFVISITAMTIGIIGLVNRPFGKKIVTGDMLIDEYWVAGKSLKYVSFNSMVQKSIIQYLIFLFILFSIIIYFEKEDYMLLLRKVSNWCKISIIWGCIEFIFKNILSINIFTSFINSFFGYNENVFLYTEKMGRFIRLSGMTTEASHYAYTLFLIAIIEYANIKYNKKERIWLWLSLILLLISMSFSSILYIVAFILIYKFIENKNTVNYGKKIIYVIISFVAVVVLAAVIINLNSFQNSYYGKRLMEILNDSSLFIKLEALRSVRYTSSRVRLISIITTVQLLLYRPLFGLGLGAASSHGSFAMILSNLGIVGTLSWIMVLFFSKPYKLFKVNNLTYICLICIWCVVGLFTSHFLGMLYNAENYIIMISFLVLCEQNTSVEMKENEK